MDLYKTLQVTYSRPALEDLHRILQGFWHSKVFCTYFCWGFSAFFISRCAWVISVSFSFQCSFSVLYDTSCSLKWVASSFNLSFSLGGFAASSAMSCWHGRAAFVEQAWVCSSGVSKLLHNMENALSSSFWCALEIFFFALTVTFFATKFVRDQWSLMWWSLVLWFALVYSE